ncbi:precorrin-3B C(17)-methyltransferase [Halosquirtibacter laminarini]|uniref:Precorrin-3B C(17)-methyltransferase n=1 Tax=Halosquirtibacter laminarini TaxID=3374600 RepID=A0AC61NK34_9BACT|nr:precorrin-3B C(17)-methyltransferase [Prolixibacteraceae bacterium]
MAGLGKITVVGLGPGDLSMMTHQAIDAIKNAEVIVGYKYYFQFVKSITNENVLCVDTGMKKERERARIAFEYAHDRKRVVVISSGDSGIYGMAPLIEEMAVKDHNSEVAVEIVPGISAFQAAAAVLGAPIGHDLCTISLSDLLTPWPLIERRIEAAAIGDFVTSIYNPKSKGRYWQLKRFVEIYKKHRSGNTPVGVVRQVAREEQSVTVCTLDTIDFDSIDMFTILVVGNSQSYSVGNKIITPRGYYNQEEAPSVGVGQSIMIKSFKQIKSELKNPDISLNRMWPLLHLVHTSADFDMENIFYCDEHVMENWHKYLHSGSAVVITDVTMVKSGIRKAAIERLGVQVKCYLSDERTAALAKEKGITRTQAGIRLASEDHPNAIYAFGNAPTALIELTELIRKGKVSPTGVVAAPVGFVNVVESKHRMKSFDGVDKCVVEGRKGGSSLAATILNAALSYDDAVQMLPGRDL